MDSGSVLQNCLLSNFHNLISVRLDSSNYVTWKFLVETMFAGCGLMKYIDGSFPCPAKDLVIEGGIRSDMTKEYKDWVQNDSAVMSILAATLSSDALSFIIGSKSSKEIWCRLKEKYVDDSRYNIMVLKNSLYKIKKGSDSIDRYLFRVKSICDQLATMGVYLDAEEIVISVVNGLPSEFTTIKTIIRIKALSSSVSMKDLRSLLLIAEDEINETVKSISMSLETAMASCGDTSRGTVQSHSLDNSCSPTSEMVSSSSTYAAIISNTIAPTSNSSQPVAQFGYVSQPNAISTTPGVAYPTGGNMPFVPSTEYMMSSGGYSPSKNGMVQSQVNTRCIQPNGSIQHKGGFVGSQGFMQQGIAKNRQGNNYYGQNKNNGIYGHGFKLNSDGSKAGSLVHNNQVTQARSSDTQSVCSSADSCQICSQFGHFAGNRPQRPAPRQVVASGSYMQCQICLSGHSAAECFHRHHYVLYLPTSAKPHSVVASSSSQSMSPASDAQSNLCSSLPLGFGSLLLPPFSPG